MSATYTRRRVSGCCTHCGGQLLPEWGDAIICPTCQERRQDLSRFWSPRDLVKKRKIQASYRARRKERLMAAGQCVKCEEPSEVREDGQRRERCLACNQYAADRQRERWQEKRRAAA